MTKFPTPKLKQQSLFKKETPLSKEMMLSKTPPTYPQHTFYRNAHMTGLQILVQLET
jgi:hypothetical protein